MSKRLSDLLSRTTHNVLTGSVSAVAILVLAGFGLFWLGIALHWALLPALGLVWAWLVPALLYLAAAAGIAWAVFRARSGEGEAKAGETQGKPPSAEAFDTRQLGMELGMELSREVEREVRDHPLRAVSIAMLGGAVLGASPELRRTLFGRAGNRSDRT